VGRADRSGVLVESAGDDGVFANTTRDDHLWGFNTPDAIWSGSTLASGGPLMFVAQNDGDSNLERGDVVAVSDMGAPIGESDTPAPLVQRVDTLQPSPIFGVVYSRFALMEKIEQVEQEGQVEQHTTLRAESTEGPAAYGEYLLVVVLGAAQAKVESFSGDLYPGALLKIDTDDRATAVDSDIPVGAIVGTAMQAPEAAQDGLIWVLVNPR